MARLLVDAMNVVGTRPTGWWRDRPAALRALLARLQGLAAADGDEVVLVLDRAPTGLGEGMHGAVRVVHARRGGRDAADDRIVELVAGDPSPSTLQVVSSDRDLRRRVAELGAGVSSPQHLLSRLERAPSGKGVGASSPDP